MASKANYLLMSSLFLIFFTITFLFVTSTFTAVSAIYIVSNNATKRTEFVLFNRRSVVLPNYHRNRTSFKFSLLSSGGPGSSMNIITRVEEKNPNSWRFIIDNNPGPAAVHFAKKEHPKNPFITEYTFHWIGDSDRREVCFHYGHNNASWYNTYQSLAARWPMDTGRLSTRRHFNYLLDFDYDSAKDEALLVLEHLFLNSDGFALMLDSSAPLFLRRDPNFGDPLLCISVNNTYPYSSSPKEPASYRGDIKFRLFSGKSAKAVYGIVANQLGLIPKPVSVPATDRFFCSPIWTTWNVFSDGNTGDQKNLFNQENVLKYADNLVNKYGFPNDSTLELHRRWERTYGDLAFDPARFPDPKEMVRKLHLAGHQVTLWSYPNIHTDSAEYPKAVDYFVKANSTSTFSSSAKFRSSKPKSPPPLVINYSDGAGSYVDFSNQAATKWFVGRLKRFAELTGVDGYHLNEAVLYDYRGPLGVADPEIARVPSLLTKNYANIAYQLSESLGGGGGDKRRDNHDQEGLLMVVDSAFKNQYLPNFVALNAKAGDWSYANGLRTLIPAVLSLSLAGYSFIIPGIIGGGYAGVLEPPPEELYIRWAQATTLMTSMKFGLPPWIYSNQRVVEITRDLVNLHRQHSDLLVELAGRRVREGAPIIRPLWWAAPEDQKAYLVDDQFMVGDDLLVAPVVIQGATKRMVRLPPGAWADHLGRGPFQGPGDIEVEAPLEVLPYFKRIKH